MGGMSIPPYHPPLRPSSLAFLVHRCCPARRKTTDPDQIRGVSAALHDTFAAEGMPLAAVGREDVRLWLAPPPKPGPPVRTLGAGRRPGPVLGTGAATRRVWEQRRPLRARPIVVPWGLRANGMGCAAQAPRPPLAQGKGKGRGCERGQDRPGGEREGTRGRDANGRRALRGERVQGKGSGKWREANRRRPLQTATQPRVMPDPLPPNPPERLHANRATNRLCNPFAVAPGPPPCGPPRPRQRPIAAPRKATPSPSSLRRTSQRKAAPALWIRTAKMPGPRNRRVWCVCVRRGRRLHGAGPLARGRAPFRSKGGGGLLQNGGSGTVSWTGHPGSSPVVRRFSWGLWVFVDLDNVLNFGKVLKSLLMSKVSKSNLGTALAPWFFSQKTD